MLDVLQRSQALLVLVGHHYLWTKLAPLHVAVVAEVVRMTSLGTQVIPVSFMVTPAIREEWKALRVHRFLSLDVSIICGCSFWRCTDD